MIRNDPSIKQTPHLVIHPVPILWALVLVLVDAAPSIRWNGVDPKRVFHVLFSFVLILAQTYNAEGEEAWHGGHRQSDITHSALFEKRLLFAIMLRLHVRSTPASLILTLNSHSNNVPSSTQCVDPAKTSYQGHSPSAPPASSTVL